MRDPLSELITTVLSQNTNDHNRDIAYRRLRETFPAWHDVMEADVDAVQEAIRPAGLSKQKSERIRAILRWARDTFGSLTLEPLGELSDDEAIDLLTTQKGIGVKTAAVVLAFAFNRDLCPVDTHVHRIARRLEWVSDKATAEATFHAIRPYMPKGNAHPFHLNLLRFGRNICTARRPRCKDCPLRDDCTWEGKGGYPEDNY